jgi:hypothetical protein
MGIREQYEATEELAAAIRNIQSSLGKDSQSIAKQAGITPALWQAWRNGKRLDGASRLVAALERLGWSVTLRRR